MSKKKKHYKLFLRALNKHSKTENDTLRVTFIKNQQIDSLYLLILIYIFLGKKTLKLNFSCFSIYHLRHKSKIFCCFILILKKLKKKIRIHEIIFHNLRNFRKIEIKYEKTPLKYQIVKLVFFILISNIKFLFHTNFLLFFMFIYKKIYLVKILMSKSEKLKIKKFYINLFFFFLYINKYKFTELHLYILFRTENVPKNYFLI